MFIQDTKVPALFRQVFLIAGFMFFIGTFLGIFVDEIYFIIAFLVATRLWISAVLGYYPMAMILSLMPWNKK